MKPNLITAALEPHLNPKHFHAVGLWLGALPTLYSVSLGLTLAGCVGFWFARAAFLFWTYSYRRRLPRSIVPSATGIVLGAVCAALFGWWGLIPAGVFSLWLVAFWWRAWRLTIRFSGK